MCANEARGRMMRRCVLSVCVCAAVTRERVCYDDERVEKAIDAMRDDEASDRLI
jgi:hypothetical protein